MRGPDDWLDVTVLRGLPEFEALFTESGPAEGTADGTGKDRERAPRRTRPEEYRESMLKNVRLNREIMVAWAEHGEQAVGEGDAD